MGSNETKIFGNTPKLNTVELFAGSCSFSNVMRSHGHNTFTTDYKQFGQIDLVKDVLELNIHDFPYKPDILWASPPCTSFSVASIGKHWNEDHTPKTAQAAYGVKLVIKTMELIQLLEPKIWFVENPRGKLRKLNLINGTLHTVTYCQYGDTRMKPTDIWTNSGWFPRPICKNGDACHVSAPRGSRTGTQGIKGNYERSKIPPEIFDEILGQLT